MTKPAHSTDPIVELLQAAHLPVDDDNLAKGEELLGHSLVWFGQEYLAQHSSDWDVELFFETYGIPRNGVHGWPQAILAGLSERTDISQADREEIFARARASVIGKLTAP
jgi:hypothetical protein